MFTQEERAEIRHHMGYMNVESAQTFQLGVPMAVPTNFLIEGALNKVIPSAEGMVREIVAKLQIVESQMVEDLELLSVDKVDSIDINRKEMNQLRREYKYWQNNLSNLLGVPANPYDQRSFGSNNVTVI